MNASEARKLTEQASKTIVTETIKYVENAIYETAKDGYDSLFINNNFFGNYSYVVRKLQIEHVEPISNYFESKGFLIDFKISDKRVESLYISWSEAQ